MKSLIFICLASVLSAVCVMSSCEKESAEPVVSIPILPDSQAIAPWKPAGDPSIYRGEELYDFIDGGAEIVHEYGFRQAISHSYENDAGKGINLEVYIMEDPASAYGLYTFRTGKNGHSVEIGDEAFLHRFVKFDYVAKTHGKAQFSQKIYKGNEHVEGRLFPGRYFTCRVAAEYESDEDIFCRPLGERCNFCL